MCEVMTMKKLACFDAEAVRLGDHQDPERRQDASQMCTVLTMKKLACFDVEAVRR
jgi:hypothetical protein